MKKRKLLLIFDRDFSLWLDQNISDQHYFVFPKVWGKGLEDYIIHYTDRSTELYRYEDDHMSLADYMVHKEIDSEIYSEKTHLQFRKDVKRLRELISVPYKTIKNVKEHYHDILETFSKMYPYYTLSVFVPGPWRERILAFHGDKARPMLERVYKSRELSEGVAKLCGDYLREWLGSILREKTGYPKEHMNIFTVQETTKFVDEGVAPNLDDLKERAKGYVYMGRQVLNVTNFDKFLENNKLEIEKHSLVDVTSFKGTVASQGGIIRGRAQSIFNSKEVAEFKKGRILITPMTSPEYIPAIHKAIAIVTDEGGVSCHAAIVSRELGIPCVIGTKIATKVLKDGDLVEVDANNGIVKKIN